MLPAAHQHLLDAITSQLACLPGVQALVLGGSWASGTAHAGSDLDLGLYYHAERPFSIQAIRGVAERAAAGGAYTVTGFYEWGAWVNGGAWVHTPSVKVDFLYRSLEHVQRTIDEACQGILHHDYDQQPAYGFYSVIYLAETQACLPLYDPHGLIAALKAQVAVYPPKLKERIVLDGLWSAEFTLLHARGFAGQGDIYNTTGCLARAAASLTQVLFALNERYFMRDKQAMHALGGFERLPAGYVQQVESILAQPGSQPGALLQAVEHMHRAWQSVVDLTGGLYQPRFQL